MINLFDIYHEIKVFVALILAILSKDVFVSTKIKETKSQQTQIKINISLN